MTKKKERSAIAATDVPRIFDDACIAHMGKIGRLPEDADRQRFGEAIREAARIYARDAHKPSRSEIRTEIATLLSAAERRQFERVAVLIEKLSPEARRLLDARAARPGFEIIGLKMPLPDALRDLARRDQACETVETFCRTGGCYVAGQMRPSGKRSRTWEPLLHAPQPIQRPSKREAERQFVMHLQLAWLEATGEMPSLAANAARLGPFGRMVAECLKLAGADHADAAELINALNKQRREMKQRSEMASSPPPVKPKK